MDNGGPAFPQGEKYYKWDDYSEKQVECSKAALHEGMSLRDKLAESALIGILSGYGMIPAGIAADSAYNYADAMLMRRKS